MHSLFIVAGKEFLDGFRNRWIIAVTLIYAVFSLGLAYFGSAASGSVGFAPLETIIISLSSLAVLLIPLIALMLAYHAFVGEYEQGTMLLLLTYPVSRTSLLLGKFLGQGAILAVSAAAGFGLAVLAIVQGSEVSASDALPAFGWFILSATLLGWIFIAMAYVISLLASEKSWAGGVALLVWFFFVLAYDLGLLALLVVAKGSLGQEILASLLLFNPTDLFRLVNYRAIGATEFGGVLQLAESGGADIRVLLAAMVAWIVAPLVLAWAVFRKRGI
jgi:Cu-processing system permease protein